MANLAVTMGKVIVESTPKVVRRAKYLMQEITPSVSTFEHTATTTARKAKYLQVPTQSVAGASENIATQNKIVKNILNWFNGYLGKDIENIPIEDCIELKNILVSTFRQGSIDAHAMAMLKTELPFMTNNPKEYMKLMERLEQRIQQYPVRFNYKPITQALTEPNIINRYKALADNDKTIVDLLHSLKNLSPKEASIIINQSGTRFGLSNVEQVRLARMFEANSILKGKSNLSAKDIEHIAYRLQSPKDLELFGIVEPTAYKSYSDKLSQALSKVARKQIQNLEQTTQTEILQYTKETDLLGHKVKVCDIDDIKQVSGFYHTPESYGDGMTGNLTGIPSLTVSNDIYRRFANFKNVFSKPTNDMPACFTYGTKDNCILWADNGFFVNVPKRSIHASGTNDLGSSCTNIDSCIDSYVFGFSSGRNNVGEMLQKGLPIPEILSKTTRHNEYLCSNGLIQAFYTNNLKTMDKAYIELAEMYNIPILNLKGKGIVRS